MDAIQFLRTEHRKASALLQRLRASTQPGERKTLFIELKRELESDAVVEREHFYPPLLEREATAAIAGGGMRDLNRLHELLAKLEALPGEVALWQEYLDQLQQTLDEHVHKEEETLFQGARGVLNEPQREDLGERMRAHKLRLIEGGAQARASSDGAGERESQGRDTTEDLAQFARERSKGFVEDQVRYLGDQVYGLSRAMSDTAENLRRQPDQAALSTYLQRAAGGLERMSGALREGDVNRLLARSSDLIRRRPALFMGGAVMAGFMLTRFLKASEKNATGGR
jgi:hypothetical protein